jgi:hypothetical protein
VGSNSLVSSNIPNITGVEPALAAVPTASIGQIIAVHQGILMATPGWVVNNGTSGPIRGGNGGSCGLGAPGLGALPSGSTSTAGGNAPTTNQYGAGGGGAVSFESNGVTEPGGNSSQGVMIIEEYL